MSKPFVLLWQYLHIPVSGFQALYLWYLYLSAWPPVSMKTKLFFFSTVLWCLLPYQMAKILLYLFTAQMSPSYCSNSIFLTFYSFCSKFFFLLSFKSFQETVDRLWWIVVQVYTTLHFLSASHWLKYLMHFIAAIRLWVVGAKELNLISCENRQDETTSYAIKKGHF